jgi:creatinine amidohydrolase/Fe(II)-dependent formamide hydrolase-like protein
MVLGKHNVRAHRAGRSHRRGARATRGRAPTIAYVPGGQHPSARGAHEVHGARSRSRTRSSRGLLESTARSFRQHGFRDVVFLGDHGGYQASLERVAAKLDREWAKDPSCRVFASAEYYRVTQTAYVDALKARGATAAEIGVHAGLADTSLALAVDAALVRPQAMAAAPVAGVTGDQRRSSAELGNSA